MTQYIQNDSTQISNGISSDIYNVNNPYGIGVPQSPISVYTFIPQLLNLTCISPVQTVTVNQALSLNAQPTFQTIGGDSIMYTQALQVPNFVVSGLTTEGGVIAGQLSTTNLVPAVQFSDNLEMQIGFYLTIGTTVNCAFIINGYDRRGVAVKETTTFNSGSTVVSSFNSVFTYSTIISITFTSLTFGSTTTISVGNSNAYGLPSYISQPGQVLSISYAGAPYTQAQFESNVFPANGWRSLPYIGTTVQSASTPNYNESVRGIVLPNQTTNGTSLIMVQYYAMGSDSYINNVMINDQNSFIQSGPNAGKYINQMALLEVGAIQATKGSLTGQFLVPYLTSFDETGVQYPGDLSWITTYTTIIAQNT